MRRAPLLLLLLATAACDSGGDEAPRLAGLYVATSTDGGVTATITLDVTASAGAFTLGPRSAYRIEGPGGSAEGAVAGTGTYDPPALTISVDETDLGDGVVLDATTLTGTASASGDALTLAADGETLVYRRQ